MWQRNNICFSKEKQSQEQKVMSTQERNTFDRRLSFVSCWLGRGIFAFFQNRIVWCNIIYKKNSDCYLFEINKLTFCFAEWRSSFVWLVNNVTQRHSNVFCFYGNTSRSIILKEARNLELHLFLSQNKYLDSLAEAVANYSSFVSRTIVC